MLRNQGRQEESADMTVTGLAARVGGRAGGLAVAVGIGAAIVSAAPASASTDAASGSATSGTETRSTPARASHAAKRALPSPAAATASPKAVFTPRQRAIKTVPTAATTPAETTVPVETPSITTDSITPAAPKSSPTPGRQLPLGRAAIASSAAPTASTQANPIHDLLAVIFPWFDPRGQLKFVPKGWQFTLLPQYAVFVNKVSGHATFTDDSKYDVQGVDQYDWLKLTGITFTPLRPDTDAIMVAWRYNLDTEMFEIGPYYNSDLARIMPTEDQIISVPANETFDYSLDYNGITLTYGDTTVFKPLPETLHPNFWTSVRINGWFGGTSPAPRLVSYYLDLDCNLLPF